MVPSTLLAETDCIGAPSGSFSGEWITPIGVYLMGWAILGVNGLPGLNGKLSVRLVASKVLRVGELLEEGRPRIAGHVADQCHAPPSLESPTLMNLTLSPRVLL